MDQARRLALSLALLLASACAPLPRSEPVGPPLSRRAVVVWVGAAPSRAERARMLAYVDEAELVYRAAFGGGPLPVRQIELWSRASLPADLSPRGLRSGERLAGVAWPGLGRVALPWRGRYPLGAAIHELHHLRVGDGEHRARSWETVRRLDRALGREVWGLWGW